MRKDFVANASHELRTPLTVIAGYLDTMADDSGIDEAWSGPLRDMRAQAQRMNAIITDLLELSRLESTDGEAPRETIDVPSMLERLHRDALAASARPRHVLLELDCVDGLYGAPHEIESAFHQSAGQRPQVHARGRHRSHAMVVRRGGRLLCGHRHRHRHFRRAHPAADRALLPGRRGPFRGQGGSGLGLAIVKHALQRHGGWLDVRSTEGKGSAFTCHFPYREFAAWGCAARAAHNVTNSLNLLTDEAIGCKRNRRPRRRRRFGLKVE